MLRHELHLNEDDPLNAADHLLPDAGLGDEHQEQTLNDVMKMSPEERKKWERLHSHNPYTRAQATWEEAGIDPETVELYIDRHRQLNTLNVLQDKQRDIGYLIKHGTWDEFKKMIDAAAKKYDKKKKAATVQKKKSSDADVVFENDKVLIVSPNTWEASCKYGMGSKWCVAMSTSNQYWNDYTGRGNKFYYCISKIVPQYVVDTEGNRVKDSNGNERVNDYYKVAVLVYPHKPNISPDNIAIEVWTSADHLTFTTDRGRSARDREKSMSKEELRSDPVRRFGRWLIYHDVKDPDIIFVNPTK